MNVGYGHSITELEMELISCLKSNKGFIIFLYIVLFYISTCANITIFMIYYYLS